MTVEKTLLLFQVLGTISIANASRTTQTRL